jgi:uncharacterized protein (TIGR04141 family)
MSADSIGLTVFLLKVDQVSAFDKKFPLNATDAIPLAGGVEGRFIPLPGSPSTPRWVSAVNSLLPDVAADLGLRSQSPAGLLVLVRGNRTFVVTFGYAWQKLEDEWLERDFGRRVALNVIAKNGLVEIRAEQVFAKWHMASDRAPRASAVEEFGVEFDRDLVATVEGIPADKALGKTVRGGTSLRLNLPISSLPPLLDKGEALFLSAAYKKNWPDIDNLSPVKDAGLIAKLEAQLDADLAAGTAQKTIAMFTPAYRRDDPLVVDSYVFGRLSQSPATTPYLTVQQWLSYLEGKGLSPSVAEAKRTPIHLLDGSDDESRACTAFDCFGCEVSVNGQQFVLSSAVWYEVVPEFLKRVNSAIAKIETPKISLPVWNQVDSEGVYNSRCCEKAGFVLFDASKIWFGGGQSQFEFCDIMHPKSQTLFFAKIPSKSSGMSHLVEQVRRTAELFFSPDPAYRKQLKKGVKKEHPALITTWLDERPRAGDWNLCLVSLGRPATKLPFFAKCSLMKLNKDLRGRGHEMSFVSV